MGVILQTTRGSPRAHRIWRRIMRRLDLWDIGKHAALCADKVAESQFCPARTTQENKETEARTINLKVVNGKIQAAVGGIRGQGRSRVLFPGDTYSKTGRPVTEILRDKHPMMRTPDLADLECSSFEEYEEDPDVVPLDISEEDVMWVSNKISRAASPSGTDAMVFQS